MDAVAFVMLMEVYFLCLIQYPFILIQLRNREKDLISLITSEMILIVNHYEDFLNLRMLYFP